MNYQTWLDEQTIWINEQQTAYQKACGRYILMVIAGAMVALFALGWVVGGFPIAVQNGLIGLILGLLISLFCMLAFRAKAPRKSYLKSLKKEMAREFPNGLNQDHFAREMLETAKNNTAQQILWEGSGGRGGKVKISKGYAILFWENSVTVVALGKVERMELADENLTIYNRNEYATVRRRQENYPIKFFYRDTENTSSKKKTFSDKRFNLPTKELRDKVAAAIEET